MSKKILCLFIVLFGSVISLNGQLEISLNDNAGFTSENRLRIQFSVTNLYPVDTFFYWTYKTLPEDPSEWTISSFYDLVLCNSGGFKNSGCGLEYQNYIRANTTYSYCQFDIYVEDGFEAGCISLHLLSDCVEVDHDTLVNHNFKFDKDWPTMLEELELSSEVQIYPNPLVAVFNLSNDRMVSSIKILNSKGKVVEEREHFPTQVHRISHLPEGCYFLELKNSTGELMNLLRFVKVSN